jgi:4-hydroxybenzoate polyprenyltransferase
MWCLTTILRASRPQYWLYFAGMYVIGFALGAHHVQDMLRGQFWLYCVFFIVPANLFVHGLADLCDGDTDAFNHSTATPKQQRVVLTYIVLAMCAAVIVLIIMAHGWQMRALLGVFAVLAVLYSLPPVRLCSVPLADLLVSVVYVLPAVIGYYQASGDYPAPPAIAAVLCWFVARHLFGAVPTIVRDRAAGVHTTATMLGVRLSLLICAVLWGVFALVVVLKGYLIPWCVAAFVYPLLGFLMVEHYESTSFIARWLPWLNNTMISALIVLTVTRML